MSEKKDKNLDYEVGGKSVFEVHDSVRREKDLPTMGREPVGLIPVIVGTLILIAGSGYFFNSFGGFNNDSVYASRFYQPEPRPSADGAVEMVEDSSWIDSWMKKGKKQYANCSACHGGTGLGVPGQFPPLAGSEWVDGGTERLGGILLNGINGNFKVAGKTYNGAMPAWNTLDDAQIAQVLTYIRLEFGDFEDQSAGVVTAEQVAAAREKYGTHPTWDEAGLLAIPNDAELPGPKVDLETGEPTG